MIASISPRAESIEPLFAHNMRLWLRVWAVTQAAALVIATTVASEEGRLTLAFFVVLGGLALYHAVGVLAHTWMMQRYWAVLIFVPLGWVAILAATNAHGAFGLLIFGAIIQGFLFLPFAWAAIALAAVVTLIASRLVAQSSSWPTGLLLTQLAALLATGIMIGTVLFYIYRANREAAIRADLLRRLDAAQRDLSDRAREAGILEERQRLSRDIHDTLAQAFASVIRHLEAAQLAIDAPGHSFAPMFNAIAPHLAHAEAVSRDSLAEIRRLVWALRPSELTRAPLAEAIERISTQWGASNDVAVEFAAESVPVLHPDADVIILRATQEALSNVARHAAATQVRVTLACVDQLVQLAVEDNGRGFDHIDAPGHEGLGLAGMRERVRRVGGHLLIESRPGSGTNLTVVLPLFTAALTSTGEELRR